MTEQEKREKVIEGLEMCIAEEKDHTSCPYYPAGYTGCDRRALMSDALALLKAQEPCEDAVSRREVLNIANDWSDMPTDEAVERIEALPSVAPKAQEPRVMTLEEVQTAENCIRPVFLEMDSDRTTPDVFSWRMVKHIIPLLSDPIFIFECPGYSSALYSETYNIDWRCWTGQPTEEQREADPLKQLGKAVKLND